MSLRDTMLAAIAANAVFAVRVDAKKSSDEEILAVYNEMLAGGKSAAAAGIDKAEVARRFRNVKVQVATPAKRKGEDGKERPCFDVQMVTLEAEHIMNARRYPDGRVAITTIDGKRHEARA